MTVYFQHVGEKGGSRDFPKTIGTVKEGLRRFRFADIAPHAEHLSEENWAAMEKQLAAVVPDGFQIWGIPSGAKSVLSSLHAGDYLLLLESVGPGGSFAYGGKIIVALPGENFKLSQHTCGAKRGFH